jgi:hypothetical protein
MKLSSLTEQAIGQVDWSAYGVIFLASGFEDRSAHILRSIPDSAIPRCVVLGFANDRQKLSREANDMAFKARGLAPYLADMPGEYEAHMQQALIEATRSAGESVRIFVDYSVMTRAWYGYLVTWLGYSSDVKNADVDFAYAHGNYLDEFEPLRIEEITAIQGFEGGCAGARRTVAFYGLGYDKYATLAVHELIEPDSVVCYVARESPEDPRSAHVLKQNREIIEMSGSRPVYLPLGNLDEAFRILHEQFTHVPTGDEILAVPMGPKTHVLTTLMVAQAVPRVTCMHPRGSRSRPVQVVPTGEVSCWRAAYR